MSSYDKVVKLACKPKAAPPKPKYLDPIIAATWSEDGAVHDVCKALSPRFREPNAIVVFKALIVLHTMIRNGATDNVLSYLSTTDVLRLRNVANGQWEGYDTPQNLTHYAFYLDCRIRAYGDLKHDAVRVQSESNRDMRVSQSVDLGRTAGGPKRSKTVAGRKLRSMTVEKGLLRETKAVHKMIDALLKCKFYLDDLEDELTITALRMLVKDILVLFQAGNEGVINVLEHYFEMSFIDAKDALAIYRHFCKQTEEVVEYLEVANKLRNLLNVPIPNLKHAPVSLAGALEEYLNDPNFEQNRLEYKANKVAADTPSPPLKKSAQATTTSSSPPAKPDVPAPSSPTQPKPDTKQTKVDFFSSIETEQQSMFNRQSESPSTTHFQQPQQTGNTYNPFVQRQSMAIPLQMTGVFPHQPFIQPQPTGSFPQQPFIQPQPTSFLLPQSPMLQASPFPQMQQQQQSNTIQPQSTGFLQVQPTGSNPFRQSMVFPQPTGISPFATAANFGGGQSHGHTQKSPSGTSFPGAINAIASPLPSSTATGPPNINGSSPFAIPPRPQSTPITSTQKPPQPLTAVATHQTGTKNPFGTPVIPAPPIPKPPTLQELSLGVSRSDSSIPAANGSVGSAGVSTTAGQTVNGQETFGSSRANGQAIPSTGGSVMGNTASLFVSKPTEPIQAGSSFNATRTSIAFLGTSQPSISGTTSEFSGLAGKSPNSSSISSPASPVQPQQTGFGGIKPFKPSSSFGASLLDSLPPVSGSPTLQLSRSRSPGLGTVPEANAQTTGVAPGLPPTSMSAFPFSPASNSNQTGLGALNAQPTSAESAGFATALQPQMTGGPNPFRAPIMVPSMPSLPANLSFKPSETPSSAPPQSTTFNSATEKLTSFSTSSFVAVGQPSAFGTAIPNQAPSQ